MAVLKCMHARNSNVEYHTGLDKVSVVDWWIVPADDREDPWGVARPSRSDYATPNVVHVASFADEEPDDDPQTSSPSALFVICERNGEAPFGVVCEQSSTYLMGDDGGTIDRL